MSRDRTDREAPKDPISSFVPPPARYTTSSSGSEGGRRGLPSSHSDDAKRSTSPSPVEAILNATNSNNETITGTENDQDSIRKKILQEHNVMCTILSQRVANLRVLREYWIQGNIKGSIDALVKMNDVAVAVDFFNLAEKSLASNYLTLDICKEILPILRNLLSSRFEGYVTTALKYVKLLLESFSTVILETRALAAEQVGVNLAREDRLQRCNECYAHFKSIAPHIVPITKKHRGIGILAREVKQLLERLVNT